MIDSFLKHRYQTLEARRQEASAEAAFKRERLAAHYPLGVPGRLARVYESDGRPGILVSEPTGQGRRRFSDLPARVHDVLRETPGLDERALLCTGAFAADAGVPRVIGGNVEAAEVARYEFARRPGLIVYFESVGNGLVAEAYLAGVFDTADGSVGFPLVIARYGWGRPNGSSPVQSWESDIPSWRYIDLQEIQGQVAPADVIAHTVSWFLLSVVDAYWQIRGVSSALLDGAASAYLAPPRAVGARSTGGPQGRPGGEGMSPQLRTRLESDAQALSDSGYHVVIEQLPESGGLTRLDVSGQGRSVAFVLGSGYPRTPPGVIVFGDAGPEGIEVDDEVWAARPTLAGILEELP